MNKADLDARIDAAARCVHFVKRSELVDILPTTITVSFSDLKEVLATILRLENSVEAEAAKRAMVLAQGLGLGKGS